MKKLMIILLAVVLTNFFTSCDKETGSGLLKLSLTDAPILGADVTGVFITINEIQVHTPAYGWVTIEDFEGPETFNLLDLTRGESEFLGSLQLEGGKYNQIRFLLDAPERDAGRPANPGCYIEFADETTEPLFVPGGSQSGFKAVGSFIVPVNGTVELTADFDVRKSVHNTGTGSQRYILRPVIRLIVENQAGAIRGNVTNIPDDTGIVIYAYDAGAYKAGEADDPVGEAARFPGAVSSDLVCEPGVYKIAFLAEGNYDLIVTSFKDDEFGKVLGIIENVAVKSRRATNKDIDLMLLK